MFRLLSHPRFRAASDFLELRASTSPDLADDLAFWSEAQASSPEQLAGSLESHRGAGGADHSDDAERPARRRRRRRPAPASQAEPAGMGDA